jgi:hypothetical protein
VNSVALASPRWYRLNGVAQAVGLVLTAALLAGLAVQPKATLHVLWDMVIPLLPAVFLVNPMLWRNVCPLATLNALSGTRTARPPLSGTLLRASWGLGIGLLLVMVPARRFLFNTDGLALAATIVVVALLAVAAGALAPRRAGFCNAICPVLPVEKLYGQAPLVRVGSARCGDCTVCTPVGCIDLARTKTVAQTMGPNRRAARWLTTPFGAFAAAFPGFIVGYFTLTDGPIATAADVYLHVVLSTAASLVVLGGAAALLRLPSRLGVPALGALAVSLYYWFAAPGLSTAYGAGQAAVLPVRVAAFILVGVWLLRGRSGIRAR